jgi:hypothetical protein
MILGQILVNIGGKPLDVLLRQVLGPGTAPTAADCYGAESVGTQTILVTVANAVRRRRTPYESAASERTIASGSRGATSLA